ncbi:UNVERIFIED_CONTAM: protein EXECUTER 1, chloroplastic [Sesamum radiatum]|uniref:Protein EXECUTER 1, chloroplastic n=1 Tax=Sesamum radiatum TaxID=300843 RepID=A0AAW2MXJ7_SESRA
MASICPPTFPSPRTDSNHHKLNITNSRFMSSKFSSRSSQSGIYVSRVSDAALCCRCLNSSSSGGDRLDSGEDSGRWDFGIQETIRKAIKRFDDYFSSFRDQRVEGSVVAAEKGGEEEEEEWDWERWRKHFLEVDELERIVSILKSQLASAIEREDYEEAARIKVAIAAAATNDTVGKVMSHLKKFVDEERYGDAALLRDYAGAGLVGWWAGISEDADDPYGRIIHISAEYGRYIARSYSPRQLATASDGAPLFEVYLTDNKKGYYKQQVYPFPFTNLFLWVQYVHLLMIVCCFDNIFLRGNLDQYGCLLKAKRSPPRSLCSILEVIRSSRSIDSLDARDNKSKLFDISPEDTEDGEDRDDDSSFDNVLRDMIPGVKVKVVKVTGPEKMDRDLISKVIEQIIDEDEEEKDYDLENVDAEDEIKSENDEEHNDIELDSSSGITEEDEQNQIAVEVIVGDRFMQKISRGAHVKDLLRVPARLEKKDRLSFTITVEEDAKEHLSGGDGQSAQKKRSKLQSQRSIDHVMLDLMKSIGKGKIPMKVLRDVGELINLTISQARNRQPLSGSTTFNRIDVSTSSDPLDGLYIGAHGLYTSEVIHLKRRFGQWKEDGSTKKASKLKFYEYVEAVKLNWRCLCSSWPDFSTNWSVTRSGASVSPVHLQVAFRAKVGKRYQLPHKGIIPEEFGVIARYRGQGRLAEPGFQNPRWVDGELVILDGKYIKGGPVVGFVYWAPEYHLVFFHRLRLLD